jgi:hypothetical protein
MWEELTISDFPAKTGRKITQIPDRRQSHKRVNYRLAIFNIEEDDVY